eukprot:CAMPEP_0194088282 /NCGR_PEP_ID=MMETSP0149-20130528/28487_1 /TAXON_ID=122233 /ORGANISM="Chaetoceros debilis, Strain MM31A-1" /LENGTH=598 /DNA_ID=CAMNT_0038771897 /DNA_START=121 /DNA_END=1917 /DNA_ORIENTATION=+
MKNRAGRDPYAPKRNLSAYLQFQNAMRDTFKAENPTFTFGDLSKYTSTRYAQITIEEKAVWQARAEQDKERYLNEMSNYVPSVGYDQNGNIIAQYPHVTGSKKKQRDPGAPKRNLSAYLLYQNSNRDQFKSDNPGMTFGQLSKYTSCMYRSLTPEEKSEWEERAIRDKARFEEEMKHYVPPHGFDANGNLLAEFAVPRKNSRKNPKDPNMPKRGRGSFVLFTFDERPKIFAESPNIKFTELGAVLGQRWRALPSNERTKYDELAEQDKLRFAREMVIYKERLNEQEQQMRLQQQQLQQHQVAAHPLAHHAIIAHPQIHAHVNEHHGIIQDALYHEHHHASVQEEEFKYVEHHEQTHLHHPVILQEQGQTPVILQEQGQTEIVYKIDSDEHAHRVIENGGHREHLPGNQEQLYHQEQVEQPHGYNQDIVYQVPEVDGTEHMHHHQHQQQTGQLHDLHRPHHQHISNVGEHKHLEVNMHGLEHVHHVHEHDVPSHQLLQHQEISGQRSQNHVEHQSLNASSIDVDASASIYKSDQDEIYEEPSVEQHIYEAAINVADDGVATNRHHDEQEIYKAAAGNDTNSYFVSGEVDYSDAQEEGVD